MTDLADPITWRGFERLFIDFGAIVFGYMGYRLYALGVTRGKGDLDFKSPFFTLTLNGAGPGVLCMALGAIVLMMALFSKGELEQKRSTPVAQRDQSSESHSGMGDGSLSAPGSSGGGSVTTDEIIIRYLLREGRLDPDFLKTLAEEEARTRIPGGVIEQNRASPSELRKPSPQGEKETGVIKDQLQQPEKPGDQEIETGVRPSTQEPTGGEGRGASPSVPSLPHTAPRPSRK